MKQDWKKCFSSTHLPSFDRENNTDSLMLRAGCFRSASVFMQSRIGILL